MNLLLIGVESLSERIFIGVLIGITMALFMSWKSKKKQVKLDKLNEEQRQREGAEEYEKCLKSIVVGSKVLYRPDLHIAIEQLKAQCNPQNFVNPYNPEKIETAARVFSELKSIETKNLSFDRFISVCCDVRDSMGVTLDTADLFNLLSDIFNPQKFVGENFEQGKLKAANKAYQHIIEFKNDRIELELFAKRIGLHKSTQCKVQIFVNYPLNGSNRGNIADILGKYRLRFIGITEESFYFVQTENHDFIIDDLLSQYVSYDKNDKIYFLKIPKDDCEVVETSYIDYNQLFSCL
jgi:hypothetical protein